MLPLSTRGGKVVVRPLGLSPSIADAKTAHPNLPNQLDTHPTMASAHPCPGCRPPPWSSLLVISHRTRPNRGARGVHRLSLPYRLILVSPAVSASRSSTVPSCSCRTKEPGDGRTQRGTLRLWSQTRQRGRESRRTAVLCVLGNEECDAQSQAGKDLLVSARVRLHSSTPSDFAPRTG